MPRLKKGSPAALAWGRKMKRLRSPKTKSKRRSTTTPKRRKSIKYRGRSMAKKKRSKSRKTATFLGINTGKAVAAGLYGAARARISNFLAPYTAKLPLGNVADEAGMVIGLTLIKKFLLKRAGILRDAATIGQGIEFARIGEAFATGRVSLGALTPTTNQGNLF